MMASIATPFAMNFAFQFLWGLVILTGFIGWGWAAHRLVVADSTKRPDWGLSAGWGMAVSLFVGGILNAAGLVSPGIVTVFVVVGVGVAVVSVLRDKPKWQRPTGWMCALAVLILIPILSRYGAAVSYQAMSCSDDDIAYFPFLVRMLETGTLLDPFSLRRLAGYGGQTFLQTLNVAVGTIDNAYLVDRGVAMIISFGLLIGYFKSHNAADPLAYMMCLLLAVLLPFPMLNSASHISGLALFLTLFRSLDLVENAPDLRPRMFWLLGLLIAAIASLRAHYLAAATFAIIAFLMIDLWRNHHAARARVISLFHVGGASVVFLSPWMATLWTSSATPMYPVFPGTHRPDYENYSAPLDFGAHLSFFGDVMISPGVALFAVPVILYAFRRASLAGLALYIGALVTTAVLAWVFTYSDAENIHRYVAPFLNAAFFATVSVFVLQTRAALPTGRETIKRRRLADAVLCGAIVFLFPVMVSQDVARLTDKWGKPTLPAASRAVYARLQAAVPAGEKLFAVVSQPAALDYRRNEIAGVDVPGAASPNPAMPFFAGPAALRDYLKKQGFHYLAFRAFSRPGGCLYDRRLWTHNQNSKDSRYREGRFQARYYLDLMDNIEALAVTEEKMFSEAGLTLLRLNGP